MTINERIAMVRNEQGLSVRGFATRLNVSASLISNMENGKRQINDRILAQIASEFGISITWLRTGEGEMFTQGDANTLSRLSEEYNLSDIEYAFMAEYLKLPQAHRAIMNGYLRGVVGRLTETPDGQQVIAPPQPAQSSIEAELEAYRLELEAEEKGTTSSPSAAQSGA